MMMIPSPEETNGRSVISLTILATVRAGAFQ